MEIFGAGRHEQDFQIWIELLVGHRQLELISEVDQGPDTPDHHPYLMGTGKVNDQTSIAYHFDVLVVAEDTAQHVHALIRSKQTLFLDIVRYYDIQFLI
ncbi:hypothetical protein SDC9_185164 [bioreactor metagenome]|uniref:Uncharacterized protein n=1 Tax=bioreactor metagenome TaxID=1076179 RepID=A0A645HNG0_9ZZZZ